VQLVLEVIDQTEPAGFSPEQWRQMLRTRQPELRRGGTATKPALRVA
jgi:hypothetical protein